MLFGLFNAPSIFQATMNQLFAPYLCKFVIVFFDDILMSNTSLEDHFEHLHRVLNCLHTNHFFVSVFLSR